MKPAEDEGTISIPAVYVGAEDIPVLLANQFVVQHDGDEFVLTVGQGVIPILLGSAEEQEEQARMLSYAPIRVVARLGMTRSRVVELIGALQENLDRHDGRRGPR
jgi:hypothetical protein